jgi:iron-sulfur cluster assembly protein
MNDKSTAQDNMVYKNVIEVTPRAERLLEEYLTDREKSPIRLFVTLGGCGIRSFGLAMEKRKKSDVLIEVNGFSFVIHRKLLENVKPIKVDADRVFFRISGRGIPVHDGCGSCGYMCGAKGRGRCTGDCINCMLPCAHGRRVRAAVDNPVKLY